MAIGVPIKLLHESCGHIITVELSNGSLYRGKLSNVEDSMNMQLTQVTHTMKNGQMHQLECVYVRGSMVRWCVVPDMLKHAPMFKNITTGGASRGRGLGAGRGALRGRAMRGRGSGMPR